MPSLQSRVSCATARGVTRSSTWLRGRRRERQQWRRRQWQRSHPVCAGRRSRPCPPLPCLRRCGAQGTSGLYRRCVFIRERYYEAAPSLPRAPAGRQGRAHMRDRFCAGRDCAARWAACEGRAALPPRPRVRSLRAVVLGVHTLKSIHRQRSFTRQRERVRTLSRPALPSLRERPPPRHRCGS